MITRNNRMAKQWLILCIVSFALSLPSTLWAQARMPDPVQQDSQFGQFRVREGTELLFIVGICFVLWIFRQSLFETATVER